MVYHQTERSERARQVRRDHILKAARKLFARHGYNATTMQDIVDLAGTSIGNAYFYFKNKAEILRTLLEEALAAAYQRTEVAMANAPAGPRKLAVMAYTTAIGLLSHDRDLTRLIAGIEEHGTVQLRLVELNTPRVRKTLQEAFPEYPADQLELAVSTWSGAARHAVRYGASDGVTLPPEETAAFIVRWNLRAMGVAESAIDDAIRYANAVVVT